MEARKKGKLVVGVITVFFILLNAMPIFANEGFENEQGVFDSDTGLRFQNTFYLEKEINNILNSKNLNVSEKQHFMGTIENQLTQNFSSLKNKIITSLACNNAPKLQKQKMTDSFNALFKEFELMGATDDMPIKNLVDLKLPDQSLLETNLLCHVTSIGSGHGDAVGLFNFPPTNIIPLLLNIAGLLIILPGLWRLACHISPIRVTAPFVNLYAWYYETEHSTTITTDSMVNLRNWEIEGPQVGFVLPVPIIAPSIFWKVGGLINGYLCQYYCPKLAFLACCYPISASSSIANNNDECPDTCSDETPSCAVMDLLSWDSHNPIFIDGNDDFKEENGVRNGSVTPNDPYIIENWEINAGSVNGIDIRHTDAYFIIRNCYVHSGGLDGGVYEGISLSYVENGVIADCICSDNKAGGIYINCSDAIFIDNCRCFNNINGIGLWDCEGISIKNCYVYDNLDDGIELLVSHHNFIENCTLSGNTYGVFLWRSRDNEVWECDFNNASQFGLKLSSGSRNNIIKHCNFSNNLVGSYAESSFFNKVNYNNFNGNLDHGFIAINSIVDVSFNWWGSDDGPGGGGTFTKLNGGGDKILWGLSAIIFDPWLTEPA